MNQLEDETGATRKMKKKMKTTWMATVMLYLFNVCTRKHISISRVPDQNGVSDA